MIRKAFAAVLSAAVLGLATLAATTGTTAQAKDACVATHYWKLAGEYHYRSDAYHEAAYLEKCGYCTYVAYKSGYYCVYYK
jgi:hypothetical protein